ncbi:MAG: VanZ family protein, partial [Clostridia bacterium]|nr:VanZ family protein [Clostridia bacterium]
VYEYIEKIINNRINVDTAITNLIGNIIVFLPMGAFLPCLFQKMRSFKKTVLTVFFIVLGIELLEIILAMGTFDIDDFIFNLGGAMIGYAVMLIPVFQKIRNSIFEEKFSPEK